MDAIDPSRLDLAREFKRNPLGPHSPDLQKLLKNKFEKVVNFKPPASRSDSSEKFVIATGFRG